MAERRVLALHLRHFAAERVIRREPALTKLPLALWAQEGPRRLVTAVNARAATVLAPGMPLADALAMLPGLVTRPADPRGDAAALVSLASWCLGFTPLAAPLPPDGLVLDIAGCAHLWGGEAAMLAEVTQRVRRLGFSVAAAIADTAPGAAALTGTAAAIAGTGEADDGAAARVWKSRIAVAACVSSFWMGASVPSTTVRLMTFSSSRTLPGQS